MQRRPLLRRNDFRFTVLAAALLVLNGCATRYSVLTNAYLDRSSSIPRGAKFAVLPNQNPPNVLFDAEVKRKTEKMIAQQGFDIVPPDQAAYFLSYTYDIAGAPKTMSWPQINNGPEVVRRIYVTGANRYYTVVTPGYSYITHVTETSTVYTARLLLKVFEAPAFRENGTEKTVWVGDAMNESENPDLRESADYLIVGIFRYFGQDTVKGRSVVLDASDKNVSLISRPDPVVAGSL